MNYFTIRDIENLSGIKAHTLRIWEQRYDIMTPKRKESLHRMYDNEDLKQILRVSYLYHNGFKISKIAKLKPWAYNKLPEHIIARNEQDYQVNQLLEASIDVDDERFELLVNQVLRPDNIEDGVLNVVYPYLQKIGLLWLTEHIVPAQEHFASSIICRKLLAAIEQLPRPGPSASNILLFMPRHEFHEIATLVIYYLLKKYNKTVIYFGQNANVSDLQDYCSVKPVTHLYFHLLTNFLDKDVNAYLQELSAKFPDKQIVMSGPCAAQATIEHGNVSFLRSMEELLEFAKS